eukprot:Opistho-2@19799
MAHRVFLSQPTTLNFFSVEDIAPLASRALDNGRYLLDALESIIMGMSSFIRNAVNVDPHTLGWWQIQHFCMRPSSDARIGMGDLAAVCAFGWPLSTPARMFIIRGVLISSPPFPETHIAEFHQTAESLEECLVNIPNAFPLFSRRVWRIVTLLFST